MEREKVIGGHEHRKTFFLTAKKTFTSKNNAEDPSRKK